MRLKINSRQRRRRIGLCFPCLPAYVVGTCRPGQKVGDRSLHQRQPLFLFVFLTCALPRWDGKPHTTFNRFFFSAPIDREGRYYLNNARVLLDDSSSRHAPALHVATRHKRRGLPTAGARFVRQILGIISLAGDDRRPAGRQVGSPCGPRAVGGARITILSRPSLVFHHVVLPANCQAVDLIMLH